MDLSLDDLVDCFNTNMRSFVSDLQKIYPSDQDIMALKQGISVTNMIDNRKAMNMFEAHVSKPYGDRLLARDEAFFMTGGFESDMSKYEAIIGIESDSGSTLLTKLRGYWSTMDVANKKTVWDYFRVLINIVNRYRKLKNLKSD